MKRQLSLLVSILLITCLCSCGKSEAAQAVDDLIASLEVVDENSRAAIEEVEAAYNALSDKDKAAVENYAQLEKARSAFHELMARQAISAIERIGNVNGNSWDDIQNARKIYDSLTDDEQRLVSNYSDLIAAEEQFINIKITPVEELITKIPAFDISSNTLPDGFVDAVESANKAYEELDEALKAEVRNHDELIAALTFLSNYRVNILLAEIEMAGEAALSKFTARYDEIEHTTYYLHKSSPEYVNSRTAFYFYIAKRDDDGRDDYSGVANLRCVAHYVGNDWLFFKTIIINIDGETVYEYTPRYSDIIHNNAQGKVWEILDYFYGADDGSITERERDLLAMIAASEKTIVCFKSDTFRYDYTITQDEKAAISDVLAVYDYFRTESLRTSP